MVKWLTRRWLDRFEREWQYDASYMREMVSRHLTDVTWGLTPAQWHGRQPT